MLSESVGSTRKDKVVTKSTPTDDVHPHTLYTLQDVSALTEEEQLALALQMSLQQGGMEEELQPMDTNTTPTAQSTEVRVGYCNTTIHVSWY